MPSERVRRQKYCFKWRILILLFSALSGFASGAWATYTLPADRSVAWHGNVGVLGDIPNRTEVFITLSPSGGDDASAIQTALDSCPSGQVVKLEAGTFNISSTLTIKSNTTLRGAGKGKTIISGIPGYTGATLIHTTGSTFTGSVSYPINDGLDKGSTRITTKSAHDWNIGDIILIDQLNDVTADPPVSNIGLGGTCTWCGRMRGARALGQLAKIIVITSNTADLEIPLYWSYNSRLSPQATKYLNVITESGIEDLTVDNSISGNSNQNSSGTIYFDGTSNCWLLNVEIIGSWQSALQIKGAYRNTIRSCTLHEGIASDPAKYEGHSYGTQFTNYCSANLLENNRFYKLGTAINLAGAISGNVFSYNYIHDIVSPPSSPDWQKAVVLIHGGHPLKNLFESNFTIGRLSADNYWGTSSHNTFFRNRSALDTGKTGATWDVDLQYFSRSYTFVGNILGAIGTETVYEQENVLLTGLNSIYRLGYTSDGDGNADGNDSGVLTTLLRHGNWDSVNASAVWNNFDDTVLPSSYYLDIKPIWWESLQWPAIGPDVSPMYPAEPDSYEGMPWDIPKTITPPLLYPANIGPTPASVDLTWDEPTEYTDGTPLTSLGGYKIYTGNTPGNYSQVLDVGNVTSYTLSGLNDGTTYYFAVTAYSTGGSLSLFSSEVSFTIQTPPVLYTINSTAGSGGTISPTGTITVDSGGIQTFAITPNTGFQITGVIVDGTSVGAVTNYTFSNVTANHTISAAFTAIAYTITATAGSGGTISPTGTTTISSGESQTFTIAPNSGYQISAVTVDGTSVGAVPSYTFSNVTANHTISAAFSVNETFTITATAGTGGAISPTGTVAVNSGANQTFTITPNTGFQITGVTVDGASVGAVTSYTFSNVTANHTISAAFTAITYTITATAGTGGTISPAGAVAVNSGANQTFTITPNTGFQITGVIVDGTSVGAIPSYTFSNVTANHTISAAFTAITYTITATAGTGGVISPTGAVTMNSGANQTFTITPNTGFQITGVTIDGASVGAVTSYTFSNVTANHTISASFSAASFTITATAGTGGTISPAGAVTVNSGANQTFTITPNSGYQISEITVDGTSVGAVPSYTFSNVTANHTISAAFTAITYTITATAGSGGAISPTGAVAVNSGANQTFTITPNSGYQISAVTVDGASVGAVTSYTFSNVTANHTISASFSANALADLAIFKTSDKAVYKPSTLITYTVTVTNSGPSDAQAVVVTDQLPSTQQAVYLSNTGGCSRSGNTLTCTMGTLTVGQSTSFNISETVKGSRGIVTNTATVTSSTPDPNTGNNISSKIVTINGKN